MNYVQKFKSRLKEELPNCDSSLLDLYTLLGLTVGKDVDNRDVHDAWSIWKNPVQADHRSLIPFNELSKEVQELDTKYTVAIRKVAREILGY